MMVILNGIILFHNINVKKKDYYTLISARSNVVEVCKACHDLTTASMLKSNLEGRTTKVSEENADKEPTENQLKYIKN